MAIIVQDIMTENPITLRSTATVGEAFELLQEHDVRHLPVIDEEGQLAGMLSDRDLRSLALPTLMNFEQPEASRDLLLNTVGQIMHSDVVQVHPQSELPELVELMIDHKFGAVPVVEPIKGELVGIVSYIDVLRATQELL